MKRLLIILILLPLYAGAQKWTEPDFRNFRYPEVRFTNLAEGTRGWEIYDSIVPAPIPFIKQHALWVVKTLYWSDRDSVPDVRTINYTIENKEGISAKSGGQPEVNIFYSSRWVEFSFGRDGSYGVLYETRGVLYHELTHAYQYSPKGCGVYRQGDEYWTFIEGMADAVRYHNGFFPVTSRKPGGHWMDGYRTTGFFLQWLTSRDPDFIRKFNKTAVQLDPWSFDRAMSLVLGPGVTTDSLWEEYQLFLIGEQERENTTKEILS